jgi:hypothetical protein
MPERKSPDSDMDEQPMLDPFIYSMQAKFTTNFLESENEEETEFTTNFLSSENEGDTESEYNDEDEYVYDGDMETESEYEVDTAD